MKARVGANGLAPLVLAKQELSACRTDEKRVPRVDTNVSASADGSVGHLSEVLGVGTGV